MKWLNPVARQELFDGYGSEDSLRLAEPVALEQDVREEAGAVGVRQRERPERRRLHDRERFFREQQFAGLVEHQTAPELVGLRSELVAAPPPDLDHACEAGEGFVYLPGERERRDGIDQLEAVGCLDQVARQCLARELDRANAILAQAPLLDCANAEQETGADLVSVDSLPLRLNDRVLSWVELTGDDQKSGDVFGELVVLRAHPFAQSQ